MQHPHNVSYHLQHIFGDPQPDVECAYELFADIFAGIGNEIIVRTEQNLSSPSSAESSGTRYTYLCFGDNLLLLSSPVRMQREVELCPSGCRRCSSVRGELVPGCTRLGVHVEHRGLRACGLCAVRVCARVWWRWEGKSAHSGMTRGGLRSQLQVRRGVGFVQVNGRRRGSPLSVSRCRRRRLQAIGAPLAKRVWVRA